MSRVNPGATAGRNKTIRGVSPSVWWVSDAKILGGNYSFSVAPVLVNDPLSVESFHVRTSGRGAPASPTLRPALKRFVQQVARALRWEYGRVRAAWFHTSIDGADNVNELRPWIGLRFLGPRPGGFVFSNYFRAEYRAFKGGNHRDWETLGRARYQLQVTSPRFKIGRSEGFYALAFAEVFKNFGSSVEGLFFAQSRFDVGLGKQINRGLRLELNYLFQKATIEGTGLEPSDHILRLRMFYGFN